MGIIKDSYRNFKTYIYIYIFNIIIHFKGNFFILKNLLVIFYSNIKVKSAVTVIIKYCKKGYFCSIFEDILLNSTYSLFYWEIILKL